ncbi:hypothetical protein B0H17DRAFT_568203 [Mycena rosella]|uniref:Uncharacterized protein n=1 Tax=Mycena rosella TaxID=1033263 RepID=A0AAD7BM43_MYCRO|nr:hypothetical protein B0H17DRAFT_568203 [Mycena rosella]
MPVITICNQFVFLVWRRSQCLSSSLQGSLFSSSPVWYGFYLDASVRDSSPFQSTLSRGVRRIFRLASCDKPWAGKDTTRLPLCSPAQSNPYRYRPHHAQERATLVHLLSTEASSCCNRTVIVRSEHIFSSAPDPQTSPSAPILTALVRPPALRVSPPAANHVEVPVPRVGRPRRHGPAHTRPSPASSRDRTCGILTPMSPTLSSTSTLQFTPRQLRPRRPWSSSSAQSSLRCYVAGSCATPTVTWTDARTLSHCSSRHRPPRPTSSPFRPRLPRCTRNQSSRARPRGSSWRASPPGGTGPSRGSLHALCPQTQGPQTRGRVPVHTACADRCARWIRCSASCRLARRRRFSRTNLLVTASWGKRAG